MAYNEKKEVTRKQSDNNNLSKFDQKELETFSKMKDWKDKKAFLQTIYYELRNHSFSSNNSYLEIIQFCRNTMHNETNNSVLTLLLKCIDVIAINIPSQLKKYSLQIFEFFLMKFGSNSSSLEGII